MPKTDAGRLTICGISELSGFQDAAVTHVLSILDPDRPDPEDFVRFAPHARLTLRFDDVIAPLPDVLPPERSHIEALLEFGSGLAGDSIESEGDPLRHLLVHCHMGISRSTAAMTILLAEARPRADEDELLATVREIRPQAWPNLRMITFADELLDRRGRLAAAAGRLYGAQLRARPELDRIMREAGRGAEIDLAKAQLSASASSR